MQKRKIVNITFCKVTLCLCILFFSTNIYAQVQNKIDSLKHIIANTQNDTVKLNAFVILNEINQDRKELIEGYKQQIVLSKKIKEYAAACVAYSQLGYYEYENNNFIAAEKIATEGMALAKETGNDYAMGKFSNRLMMIYDKKGDMSTAMNYLKQGEQLLIKVNRPVNLTRLYCNASEIFMSHQLMENALLYARKAYAAAQSSGELEPMTTASFYLACRLQNIAKYDSAIYYFYQCLHISGRLGSVYKQGDALKGLSDVYAEIKEYKAAREYLNRAVAMFDSVKIPERRIVCEESLAYLDFMDKDFNKVKKYILTRENNPTNDSIENSRFVNKWYANLALIDHDVEGWEKYYRRYERADAVLVNDTVQKRILELEAKYNFSKKESELLQKDTESRKRFWIIAALALGLFTLTIIAVTQYSNYKNKRKIALQKSIIEKQNALSEERLRIAADMHDDVGAGLSRIRYITASMKDKLGTNDDDIEKIVSLSDESVEKMNEIIWALNQGNQQLDEFIYYLRSQCSEMVSNAGLAFSFELPENIPAIIIGWKDCRNIYLLVKESVNNAIKHAGATLITIDCSIAGQLQFSITDNGKGFDPAEVATNGNGLLNYKKRIEKLNGSYQLITATREGTKLVFTIPINTPG